MTRPKKRLEASRDARTDLHYMEWSVGGCVASAFQEGRVRGPEGGEGVGRQAGRGGGAQDGDGWRSKVKRNKFSKPTYPQLHRERTPEAEGARGHNVKGRNGHCILRGGWMTDGVHSVRIQKVFLIRTVS